ncbi:MAG: S8 family serine peptidase [Vulcanimicrobiaceae bacterium]
MRSSSVDRLIGSLLAATLLAACSAAGGGGIIPTPPSPSPPPTQSCVTGLSTIASNGTPMPRPTSISPTPSPITISSNPSGLTVFLDGGNVGLTPVSTTPQFAAAMHQIAFSPSNGAPTYTVCFDQTAEASLPIYYNQSADTQGSVTVTTQSVMRRTSAAVPVSAAMVRRLPTSGGAPGSAFAPNLIEVEYNGSAVRAGRVDPAELEAAAGVRSARTISPPGLSYVDRVLVVPARKRDAIAARLRGQPGVVSVSYAQYRYPKDVPVYPTSPGYASAPQWDMGLATLPTIDMPYAWGSSAGFGSASIPIAIIDTGIDTSVSNTFVQDDLIPKITYAESDVNGTTTPCPVAPITGCTTVQDDDGHGTDVAGIAGAIDTAAQGFAGTAGGTSMQIYKIFSGSSALTTDEAQAIYDAVVQGAKVINLSLGSCQQPGSGPDPFEENAVEYALSQGVFVAAAAGNERNQSSSSCPGGGLTLDYPAAYPGVMAVGASALHDGGTGNPSQATEYVASYSNTGPGLGVVAPGGDPSSTSDSDPLHWITNLYSTTGNPPCTNPAQCAVEIAGTSMATPHVAGAAALMLSANSSLTPAQLNRIIDSTADDIGDPNQGHGRLDVYRAMAVVTGTLHPPAYVPSGMQLVVFAYTNSGAVNAAPQIIDETFPQGILVNQNGSFRIADIPATAGAYKIGVWYDANADGKVDAGDYFGASGSCTPNAPCTSAQSISVAPVTSSGFALP